MEQRVRGDKPLDPIPLAPLAPPAPRVRAPVVAQEPPPVFEVEPRSGRPGPWLLVGLLMGSCAAMFFLSVRSGYLLGQIAAPVFMLSGLHGACRGALRKVVMLPVTVGVAYFVTSQIDFADPVIRLMGGKSSLIGNTIACGFAVVLAVVVVGRIVRAARDRITRNRPSLLTLDRFLGVGFGLAEATLLMLCVCWSVVLLAPQIKATNAMRPPPDVNSFQHQVTAGLLQLTDEIDEGPFRSVIRDHNLLEKIPMVRDILAELPLDTSSPDWQKRINELLRQADQNRDGETGVPFDQYQKGNRQRDKAYRSLPPPTNRRP